MPYPSELEDSIAQAKLRAHLKIDRGNEKVMAYREWMQERGGSNPDELVKDSLSVQLIKNWERLYTYIVQAISNRRRT